MKKEKVITESVEIIAASYEWICKNCDTLNKEIEITDYVTCRKCDTKYIVEDHHHAYG